MGYNLAEKIIASHLVSGSLTPGEEIALRVPPPADMQLLIARLWGDAFTLNS